MADKSKDLVITYVVIINGGTPGSDKVQKALDDGYRVLDIIATPVAVGGSSASPGFCAVTVLLTTDAKSSNYNLRSKTK